MKMLSGTVALLAGLSLLFVGATEESKQAIQEVFAPDPEVVILFGGDLMFDRTVRTYMRQHGADHVFSCISNTLKSADLVVANLEGPITTHASMSEGSIVGTPENITFTFEPLVADLLYRHNIQLVNIGNNHIMNFGFEGFEQTKNWLNTAGVEYFGGEKIHTALIRDIPFAFINYNDFNPRNTTIHDDIRTLAQKNFVIVYAHWGEEYSTPLPRIKTLARQFIDAGASVVIGSHPHVVQESELYKEKYIYYSLGNFLFDQYFSKEVVRGLLLRVTFGTEGVRRIEEMPIEIKKDRTVCLL